MKRFMSIVAAIALGGCATIGATIGGNGNSAVIARVVISQLLQAVAAELNTPAPTSLITRATLESVDIPGPSLGTALYGRGYTSTVWVSSFDPTLSHFSHSAFNPAIPLSVSSIDRWGMTLSGSGTVSVNSAGLYQASGIAGPSPSDGALFIDLLANGKQLDSASLPFACQSSSCPWHVVFRFTTPSASIPLSSLSLKIYRHVEGSACGGELTPDLNSVECRPKLVSAMGLPSDYRFTDQDIADTNYVTRPGLNTTALCLVVLPVCAPAVVVTPPPPPPPPPPPVDPCLAGCSTACPSLCVAPPASPICPTGTTCRGECPLLPPSPCLPISPCPIYVANTPPDGALATLRALSKGQVVSNKAKLKTAIIWVLSNPGLRLP